MAGRSHKLTLLDREIGTNTKKKQFLPNGVDGQCALFKGEPMCPMPLMAPMSAVPRTKPHGQPFPPSADNVPFCKLIRTLDAEKLTIETPTFWPDFPLPIPMSTHLVLIFYQQRMGGNKKVSHRLVSGPITTLRRLYDTPMRIVKQNASTRHAGNCWGSSA